MSDTELADVSKDTFHVNFKSIDKLLLLKDWQSELSKKVKCEDYDFIFPQSLNKNIIESKYAHIYTDELSEVLPRLSSYGITYHFEYLGKLYYHSGIIAKTPKYSDEEKANILKGVLTVMDLLVNRRLNVSTQLKPKGE